MEKLKELYTRYLEQAAEVRRSTKPLAGIWGMGDDPRNHHCHEDFYKALGEWVAEFSDPAETAEAVKFILSAALAHEGEDAYWYLYAAHGLTLPLIERLSPDDCGTLFTWYDACYPKRDRFPTQQQVWKALKRGGK